MADSSTSLKRRMQQLSDVKAPDSASCVMYIMSRDQRVAYNAALLAAQKHADALQLPLKVVFFLYHASGHRAQEHFTFMLDGLREVGSNLAKKNISFEVIDSKNDIQQALKTTLRNVNPAALYMDFSPLVSGTKIRSHVSKLAECPAFYVDAHNIVPVWIASNKQEIAARTIRPKINRHLKEFLDDMDQVSKHHYGTGKDNTSYANLKKVISHVNSNGQKLTWKSGEKAAQKALDEFIDERLNGYADKRNNPSFDHLSELSPYLHFGQLSALYIALRVHEEMQKDSALVKDGEAFLEEMIIRRELSDNFCFYNQDYKSLKGAPEWAQKTLADHAHDEREHIYTYEELRDGKTHDAAWNAAQIQLVKHGKMHGYMRMYWAKKVLEWTKTPETALRFLIELNDYYSIDGGDPNGYVGILWSVAGLHDHGWGERPIYGKVRSMVYSGLKRKFDIEAYEKQWT